MKSIHKYSLSILLAFALGVGCVAAWMAQPVAYAAPASTSEAESLRFTRPGLLYSHQKVSVTAASAAATVLLPWSVYRVVCDDAVFVDQGISTVTATTSEAYLPGDVVQYWRTGNTELYIAFIRKTADCSCYISEER